MRSSWIAVSSESSRTVTRSSVVDMVQCGREAVWREMFIFTRADNYRCGSKAKEVLSGCWISTKCG